MERRPIDEARTGYLFKQRKRLVDAEGTLQTKTTKKALEDPRIATEKIEWAKTKLSDLRRTNVMPDDERIFLQTASQLPISGIEPHPHCQQK